MVAEGLVVNLRDPIKSLDFIRTRSLFGAHVSIRAGVKKPMIVDLEVLWRRYVLQRTLNWA